MAYASIMCETCKFKNNPNCYCAPNSVCEKYVEEESKEEEFGD